METEPNFAFDVLRPVAVVAAYLISMRLGWMLQDWRVKRRVRREATLHNVTPS